MEKESCESCANAFPCKKYCGECGKLLNPKHITSPNCHFLHQGYRTEGGHKFCPDCGNPIPFNKDITATVVGVITRLHKEKTCLQKPPEEASSFIEINRCPQCQSPDFKRIYGGRHNKQCTKCSTYFEENASMIEHLTR